MWIAIHKRMKDLEKRDEVQSKLPDMYPALCEEFDTKGEALAKYPDATVMTTEEYHIYTIAIQDIFQEAMTAVEKPWWRLFW